MGFRSFGAALLAASAAKLAKWGPFPPRLEPEQWSRTLLLDKLASDRLVRLCAQAALCRWHLPADVLRHRHRSGKQRCARLSRSVLLRAPARTSSWLCSFSPLVTNADVACDYASYPIYPFAFRTHTHRLGESFSGLRLRGNGPRAQKRTLLVAGKVVSGYRVRDGEWTLIGRQSPQLPQVSFRLLLAPSLAELRIASTH